MKYNEQPNCNRCGNKGCNSKKQSSKNCARWTDPTGKWMLAELALAYPSSLNRALSALPFDTNLNFFLKG